MRTKPMQISVMAVAALAVFAVAAALLLSGGNPAQATNAETRTLTPDSSGGGHLLPLPQATTTPRTFPTPPPCPGETGNDNTKAAPVVDSGHIALFDVWWNPDEKELTNTSCPPTVEHVPAKYNSDGETSSQRPGMTAPRPASTLRKPSSTSRTAPRSTLNETDYPKGQVSSTCGMPTEEESASGGDRMVWELPPCPDSPATTPLCLSFSAALLSDGGLEWR